MRTAAAFVVTVDWCWFVQGRVHRTVAWEASISGGSVVPVMVGVVSPIGTQNAGLRSLFSPVFPSRGPIYLSFSSLCFRPPQRRGLVSCVRSTECLGSNLVAPSHGAKGKKEKALPWAHFGSRPDQTGHASRRRPPFVVLPLFFWVVDNFSMEKGTTTMTIVAKKKRGRVLVFLFAGNPFLLDLFFQMTTHRGSLFFFRTTKAPQKNAMAGLLGHIKTSIAHCPCIHTHQKKTKERKGSNLEKKRTTTGREISIVVVLWNHNALHIFKKKGTIIFFGLCCAYLFFIQARSCLSGLLNEEKTKKRCVSLHLAPGLSPSLFFFP